MTFKYKIDNIWQNNRGGEIDRWNRGDLYVFYDIFIMNYKDHELLILFIQVNK